MLHPFKVNDHLSGGIHAGEAAFHRMPTVILWSEQGISACLRHTLSGAAHFKYVQE